jgi:hypothetical protein
MPFDKGKSAAPLNEVQDAHFAGDRDPSPPVPEDPEVLAAEAANGSVSLPALLGEEEIMSATTSISESFQPGPDDSSAKIEGVHEPGPGIGFLEVDDDEDGESAALYPMTSYPRMTPAYRVERPCSPGDGPDTRTMYVSPGSSRWVSLR